MLKVSLASDFAFLNSILLHSLCLPKTVQIGYDLKESVHLHSLFNICSSST